MNLVVTVIGEDRPGIVERIAEEVASRGGNWLESHSGPEAATPGYCRNADLLRDLR